MRSIRFTERERNQILDTYRKWLDEEHPLGNAPTPRGKYVEDAVKAYAIKLDTEWQDKLKDTEVYDALDTVRYLSVSYIAEGQIYIGYLNINTDIFVKSHKELKAYAEQWYKDNLEDLNQQYAAQEAKYVEDNTSRKEAMNGLWNAIHTAGSTKQLIDTHPDVVRFFPESLIEKMNTSVSKKTKPQLPTFTL